MLKISNKPHLKLSMRFFFSLYLHDLKTRTEVKKCALSVLLAVLHAGQSQHCRGVFLGWTLHDLVACEYRSMWEKPDALVLEMILFNNAHCSTLWGCTVVAGTQHRPPVMRRLLPLRVVAVQSRFEWAVRFEEKPLVN